MEETKVDAKEVEQQLLEEKKQEELKVPPEVIASKMFELYGHKFEELMKDLTTGELRRLAKALVLFPVFDKQYIDSLATDRLKEAYHMGDALLRSKIILFHSVVSDKLDKEIKELKEGEKNE